MRRLSPLALLFLASCVSTPPPPEWHPVDPARFEKPLALGECVALARANAVRASEWEARLAAARAGISEAKAVPNPTVSMEWEGIGLRDAEGTSLETQKTTVNYPILFWWPRAYKVAAAEANRRAEEASVRSEQRKLVAEVGGSWFDLVADQRRVTIAQAILDNARAGLRLAQKGKDLGSASAYDVERAEAEVLTAEGAVAGAENARRLDQLSFAFALGAARPAFPQADDTEAAGSGAPAALGPAETVPDDLLALALAADPTWRKARELVEAAEQELHVQQVSAVPLADVVGGAGRNHEADGAGTMATGEVPVPLFNWNGAAIEKARAGLLAARTEEEQARRDVVSALSQDWERVRAAVRQWEAFAHPKAEKRAKVESSARKLFEAGEIDYTELLQAERDLQDARMDEVDAWRDASTARWTLESALGRHDDAPGGSQ